MGIQIVSLCLTQACWQTWMPQETVGTFYDMTAIEQSTWLTCDISFTSRVILLVSADPTIVNLRNRASWHICRGGKCTCECINYGTLELDIAQASALFFMATCHSVQNSTNICESIIRIDECLQNKYAAGLHWMEFLICPRCESISKS